MCTGIRPEIETATGEIKAVLWAAAALLVALLLALELLLRLMGFGSFPLFQADPRCVYRMRSHQAGRFLNRYAWRYDANGMRSDETPPDFSKTTLLVGDSIVDGGLRIGQGETLAPMVERMSNETVYCVACHGWALSNSLPALKALPGWDAARRVIFVLNTADFDIAGYMINELSFPSRRPLCLTLWLVRRYIFRRLQLYRRVRNSPDGAALQDKKQNEEMRAANVASFRELLAEYPGPIVLVRYPMRGEDARTERYFEQLASLSQRIRIVEAAQAPEWSDACYADHLHPNAHGIELLARHLSRGLS